MNICLIGNNGSKKNYKDGQTAKVCLYLKKIKDESFNVTFINLESFTTHPISVLHKIRKSIKSCDRVVLISAMRGCKFLIPFINRINKKYKKPFILPLIGTSVLHYSVDDLSDEDKLLFFNEKRYDLAKNNISKISRSLSKINYILPETDKLSIIFKEFYHLNNVATLNNFRENDVNKGKLFEGRKKEIKLVFLSRIMTEKGIFDLMDIVEQLLIDGHRITLDIYGKKFLSKTENDLFEKYLNNHEIRYCGSIDSNSVVPTLSKYDLMVFPTKFVGEGTPGVISESLLAGVPVLTSKFPQASDLLTDSYDSVFYEMFNKDDLKKKLVSIINGDINLQSLQNHASESGKRFTYSYNRDKFLELVCGSKVN